jgi:hypothetical protein
VVTDAFTPALAVIWNRRNAIGVEVLENLQNAGAIAGNFRSSFA